MEKSENQREIERRLCRKIAKEEVGMTELHARKNYYKRRIQKKAWPALGRCKVGGGWGKSGEISE